MQHATHGVLEDWVSIHVVLEAWVSIHGVLETWVSRHLDRIFKVLVLSTKVSVLVWMPKVSVFKLGFLAAKFGIIMLILKS